MAVKVPEFKYNANFTKCCSFESLRSTKLGFFKIMIHDVRDEKLTKLLD